MIFMMTALWDSSLSARYTWVSRLENISCAFVYPASNEQPPVFLHVLPESEGIQKYLPAQDQAKIMQIELWSICFLHPRATMTIKYSIIKQQEMSGACGL